MRALVGIAAVFMLLLGLGVFFLGQDRRDSSPAEAANTTEAENFVLGPTDGHDLPPTEIGRVAVGTVAPDFVLEAYSGRVERLSDYRGSKNVILVFYRGHW